MTQIEKIDKIYDIVMELKGDLKAYNEKLMGLQNHTILNSERIGDLKEKGTPIRARDWGTIVVIILTLSTLIFGVVQVTKS